MRFMMLMISKTYSTTSGTLPSLEEFAAMAKYNASLRKAGILLALDGLHPPAMATRVSFVGRKATVTDGPFADVKEVLGGYWVIQVKSKEEAVEWAKRCPAEDGAVIELRQVQELAEFPLEFQKVAHF